MFLLNFEGGFQYLSISVLNSKFTTLFIIFFIFMNSSIQELWDRLYLERLKEACDFSRSPDTGIVIMEAVLLFAFSMSLFPLFD